MFDAGLLRGIARYVNLHQPWEFLRRAAFYQRFSGLVEASLGEIRKYRPDGIVMNDSPLADPLVATGVPVVSVPVGPRRAKAWHILSDNGALRFIRENFGSIIQVRDVVRATFLAPRTLHNRFRREVGHSLVKEINRQRALHIARRLAGTNETLGHIARSLGYDNDAHMARYFCREMGETPRSYRARH